MGKKNKKPSTSVATAQSGASGKDVTTSSTASKDPVETQEEMMTRNQMEALRLKEDINTRLDQLYPDPQQADQPPPTIESQLTTLECTNQEIKCILDKPIKETITELEEAFKDREKIQVTPAVTSITSSSSSSSGKKKESPSKSPSFASTSTSTQQKDHPSRDSTPGSAEAMTVVTPATTTTSTVTGNGDPNSDALKGKSKVKSDKREKMSLDSVAKSIGHMTADEKVAFLLKKVVTVTEEKRLMDKKWKETDKMVTSLTRDKELIQNEMNRNLLAKSRLESLCREWQRHNKDLKEESILRLKEEEEKRKETAIKFQRTLDEIMSMVASNQQQNVTLRSENQDLVQNLRKLMGHYEKWEKSVDTIVTQKDLEIQLLNAKSAQQVLLFNKEKSLMLQEKQEVMLRLEAMTHKAMVMAQAEGHMKQELDMFTSKYQEFQEVMAKNGSFATIKKDMDRMQKQMKRLEKDSSAWKTRAMQAEQDMVTLNKMKDSAIEAAALVQKRNEQLEKLCRTMQQRSKADTSEATVTLIPSSDGHSEGDVANSKVTSTGSL